MEPFGSLRAHGGELDGDLVPSAQGQGLTWEEEEREVNTRETVPSVKNCTPIDQILMNHLSIHSFIHISIHPCINPSIILPSIHSFKHPTIYPFINDTIPIPLITHPSYPSGSQTERTAGCSAGTARRRYPPRRSGTSGTSQTGQRELKRGRKDGDKGSKGVVLLYHYRSVPWHVLLALLIIITVIITHFHCS